MALGGALKARPLVLLVALCCVFAQKDGGFGVSPRDCPHAGLVPGSLSPTQSQASLGSFKLGPAQPSPNAYGSALHGLPPESSTSASVKLSSANSWISNLPGSSNYNPVTNRCVSGSSGYPQTCSDTVQSIDSQGGLGSAEKLGILPGYVSNPTQSVGSQSAGSGCPGCPNAMGSQAASGSAPSPGTQTTYGSVFAQRQDPLSYGSQWTADSVKGIGSQMSSLSTLPIDGPTQWLGFQSGSKHLGTGSQPSYSSGLDLGVSQSLYGYPQLSATSDQVANYASGLEMGSQLASPQWVGSESSGFQSSRSFPGSGYLLGGAFSVTPGPALGIGYRLSSASVPVKGIGYQLAGASRVASGTVVGVGYQSGDTSKVIPGPVSGVVYQLGSTARDIPGPTKGVGYQLGAALGPSQGVGYQLGAASGPSKGGYPIGGVFRVTPGPVKGVGTRLGASGPGKGGYPIGGVFRATPGPVQGVGTRLGGVFRVTPGPVQGVGTRLGAASGPGKGGYPIGGVFRATPGPVQGIGTRLGAASGPVQGVGTLLGAASGPGKGGYPIGGVFRATPGPAKGVGTRLGGIFRVTPGPVQGVGTLLGAASGPGKGGYPFDGVLRATPGPVQGVGTQLSGMSSITPLTGSHNFAFAQGGLAYPYAQSVPIGQGNHPQPSLVQTRKFQYDTAQGLDIQTGYSPSLTCSTGSPQVGSQGISSSDLSVDSQVGTELRQLLGFPLGDVSFQSADA